MSKSSTDNTYANGWDAIWGKKVLEGVQTSKDTSSPAQSSEPENVNLIVTLPRKLKDELIKESANYCVSIDYIVTTALQFYMESNG